MERRRCSGGNPPCSALPLGTAPRPTLRVLRGPPSCSVQIPATARPTLAAVALAWRLPHAQAPCPRRRLFLIHGGRRRTTEGTEKGRTGLRASRHPARRNLPE